MADAREIARQIVKTSDDCLIDGVDTTTLVSRIEAHVLAYAAERERLLAEADAVVYTTRYAMGRGGARNLCMPAVDYSRAANEACERHRVSSSSPAQDEGI